MNNFEKSTPENESPYFIMPERVEVDRLSFSNIQNGLNCCLVIILFFLLIIGIPAGFFVLGLHPAIVSIIIIFIISLMILLSIFN